MRKKSKSDRLIGGETASIKGFGEVADAIVDHRLIAILLNDVFRGRDAGLEINANRSRSHESLQFDPLTEPLRDPHRLRPGTH